MFTYVSRIQIKHKNLKDFKNVVRKSLRLGETIHGYSRKVLLKIYKSLISDVIFEC